MPSVTTQQRQRLHGHEHRDRERRLNQFADLRPVCLGQMGGGRLREISPNCEPTVAMPHVACSPKAATTTVATTSATIAQGTNRENRIGQKPIRASEPTARATVGA